VEKNSPAVRMWMRPPGFAPGIPVPCTGQGNPAGAEFPVSLYNAGVTSVWQPHGISSNHHRPAPAFHPLSATSSTIREPCVP